MPLFFIDLYDGEIAVRDEDGIELDSAEEAAEQAAALLPHVARDALPGRESRNFAAFVRDESEAVVYRAALLFRGQHMDRLDVRETPGRLEADELILLSRETRAAARQVSARLQENVRDLMAVMQHVSSTWARTAGEQKERS